jgi:hypothetical protein
MVNMNNDTGVRYGVFCPNDSSFAGQEDWFDNFEPVYYGENGEEITEWPSDGSLDNLETDYYKCDKPELKATYNSNTNTGMVLYSEHIVRCALCSPCYPNAGDLGSIDNKGYSTYSLFPVNVCTLCNDYAECAHRKDDLCTNENPDCIYMQKTK